MAATAAQTTSGAGARLSVVTRVLQVGVVALAIGGLIYFASRSVGGGLAGVLLSGLVSWLAFELGMSIIQGLGPTPSGVKPRHAFLSGCATIVAGGLGLGLILSSGQLLMGVILGGVSALVTHRTRLLTLPQLGSLDLASSIPFGLLRPLAVVLALVCLAAGIALAGLGSVRVLESYTYLSDTMCSHPCGMVHGLWVQVLPDAQGNFVTRRDPVTIELRMRFRDDVAGDKIANPGSFTVTHLAAVYQPVAGRPGCDAWAPRTIHFGDTTGDLTICFAVPQPQEADPTQLVLDWADGGITTPIALGREARPGFVVSTG